LTCGNAGRGCYWRAARWDIDCYCRCKCARVIICMRCICSDCIVGLSISKIPMVVTLRISRIRHAGLEINHQRSGSRRRGRGELRDTRAGCACRNYCSCVCWRAARWDIDCYCRCKRARVIICMRCVCSDRIVGLSISKIPMVVTLCISRIRHAGLEINCQRNRSRRRGCGELRETRAGSRRKARIHFTVRLAM